jgi:hypothetical protein
MEQGLCIIFLSSMPLSKSCYYSLIWSWDLLVRTPPVCRGEAEKLRIETGLPWTYDGDQSHVQSPCQDRLDHDTLHCGLQ